MELDATYWNAPYNLGRQYRHKEQYDLAEPLLLQALELQTEFSGLYYNLGELYCETERHALAIPMYEKVIELVPDDWSGYVEMGDSYYHIKQYSEAISCYQKILDLGLEANLSCINKMMGKAHSELNKTQEAESYFRKALELSPEEPELRFNLAREFQRQGRGEEALEILEELLNEAPKDRIHLVYSVIGWVYYGKKDFKKAIFYWHKGLAATASESYQNSLPHYITSFPSKLKLIKTYRSFITN